MNKVPYANCDVCPLRDRPLVEPQTCKHALFAVVGEAPGREEVKYGKPFVGKSGKLLGAVLSEAGFNKDELHVTNAVLCHPQNNDTPDSKAVEACNARLLNELASAGVKRVLSVGVVAANAVSSQAVDKITKVRGQVLPGKGDFTVKIGLHPAFVLRKNSEIENFRRDIKSVMETPNRLETKYEVITKHTDLEDLIKKLELLGSMVAYDLETTSLEPHRAEILCISLSYVPGKAIIVAGDALQKGVLNRLFSIQTVTYTGWNAKYDNKVLLANGIKPPVDYDDGMLMHYTTFEMKGHGLKKVAVDELGIQDWEEELKAKLPKKTKKTKTTEGQAVREDSDGGFSNIPKEVLYPYAAIDSDVTRKLNFIVHDRMDDPGKHLYGSLLMPMLNLLTDMEHEGFRIDHTLLLSTIQDYSKKRSNLLQEMRWLVANSEFNPNSTRQVADILFKRFNLPSIKLTPKLSDSTDDFVISELKKLAPDNEFLDKLTRFKQLTKILGTYLEPMVENSLRDEYGDFRLYPDLMLHGTVSGRLAGGIWLTWPRPKTNEYTGVLRKLILPDRHHALIIADFDQCELRVLTCDAEDERFKEVFDSGGDPHVDTTDALYGPGWRDGMTPAEVSSSEKRTTGKTVNFAKVYGAGPQKIADTADVSLAIGKDMSEKFDKAHPKVLQYFKRVHDEVWNNGYTETKFGRKRRFELITDDNWNDIKREAGNYRVQSPANDINFKAALQVKQQLVDARIRLLVHDSIILSAPESSVDSYRKEVERIMQQAGAEYSTYVPFTAETKVGYSWGDAKV